MSNSEEKKYFSFESFNKNKMKWIDWTEQLEFTLDYIDCSIENRKIFLLNYMGGPTYKILCDKITPAKPSDISYNYIVHLLNEHFQKIWSGTIEWSRTTKNTGLTINYQLSCFMTAEEYLCLYVEYSFIYDL